MKRKNNTQMKKLLNFINKEEIRKKQFNQFHHIRGGYYKTRKRNRKKEKTNQKIL